MDTRIKKLRLEKQLSQEDLARISGTSQTVLSKIERGFSTPDAQLIVQLSELFQVSIDYLLYRSEFRSSVETLLSKHPYNITEFQTFVLLLQEMSPKQREKLFDFLKSLHHPNED